MIWHILRNYVNKIDGNIKYFEEKIGKKPKKFLK